MNRTAPRLLALVLSLVAVSACGGPQHQPTLRSDPPPARETPANTTTAAPATNTVANDTAGSDTRASTSGAPASSGQRLEFSAPIWGDRTLQLTSRRVAIIVAADQYRTPSWNLPTVASTGETLRQALIESMEYAPEDVVLLTGDTVLSQRIEAELQDMARRLNGDGNSLLVWWLGHGHNILGEQEYLTALSTGASDGGYSYTLPHDDLRTWMGDARDAVEARGGTLVTALVADACRVPTMSAPTGLLGFKPELDIEAFSSPPGQPADSTTAYTLEAANSMRAMGSRDTVSLVDVLNKAGERLQRSPEQQAEILRATKKELLLRNATNLGIVIRVEDAHDGGPIEGATIERKFGETFQGSEARFTGLSETIAGYEFFVTAPGYFPRRDVLPLTAGDSGKTVTLGLSREFVALRGRISLLGAGSASVEVTGAFDDVEEDYHWVRQTLRSSGDWELRVPNTAGPRSLRIMDGTGVEIDSIDFDLAHEELTNDTYGRVTVRVRDFGERAITAGSTPVGIGDLTATSLDLGDYELPWDLETLTEADFHDSDTYSNFYRRINGYVRQGRFDTAANKIRALLEDREYTSQRAKRDLEGKLHDLQVAHLDQVSKGSDPEAAIDAILASDLQDEDWLRARLIELLATSAKDHFGARDFGMALERLGMARDRGARRWSDGQLYDEQVRRIEEVVDSIPGQIQQVTSQWRNIATELGRENGEWDSARELLAAMKEHGVNAESIRSWEEELDREMVSLEVRNNWSRALDLKAADRLEEAVEAVRAVLDDPTCNDHYERRAKDERGELWGLIYARAAQRGFELELQGRYEEAFEAYLPAYEIKPIERTTLDQLLDEDPSIRTDRPDLTTRKAQVDASHEGEELKEQAKEAYGKRQYREACQLLEQAQQAYAAADWISAQGVVMRLRADILELDLHDIDGAIEVWDEIAALWEAAERYADRGEAIYNRSWLLADIHVDASRRGYEEAAANFHRAGDEAGEGKALMQLGWSHLPNDPADRRDTRDYVAARQALERAEPLLAAAEDPVRLGACLHGLFRALCRDDPAQASPEVIRVLQRALDAYRQGGQSQKAQTIEAEHAAVLATLDG